MMGKTEIENLKGIVPRSFQHIMSVVATAKHKQFLIRCSFIEIYNEETEIILFSILILANVLFVIQWVYAYVLSAPWTVWFINLFNLETEYVNSNSEMLKPQRYTDHLQKDPITRLQFVCDVLNGNMCYVKNHSEL